MNQKNILRAAERASIILAQVQMLQEELIDLAKALPREEDAVYHAAVREMGRKADKALQERAV